jgi:hypothetical protein
MLQGEHYIAVSFWISAISIVIITVGLGVENWLVGGPLRILSYT